MLRALRTVGMKGLVTLAIVPELRPTLTVLELKPHSDD
jgi:hypothetical protein